ncbi:carbonic anhydrase 9-like [Coccinella septempunctata]|uniref:carbonic anhydrase 9-like n=1 Tax=Coccinella septempunctata TaxID=41139 RepID=UPI001D077BDE|nr:carbonic anhydrase 9-like [Coccinella septempunctata]
MPSGTPCACGAKKGGPCTLTSPINIGDEAKAAPEDLKEPFEFNGLEKMLCTEIRNDGEQILLRICPKQSPVIIGGGLSHSEYIIDRIDFHWCSAHTINNERFPLETHILMYCTEFSGIDEALEKEGAAALSILYEFSDVTSCGICKMLPFIPQISKCIDRPVPYCVVSLKDFLPQDKANFYRYTGSTTFPPFKEGVEWTVFKQKLPITRMDLGCFTNVCSRDGNLIVSNFRPVQPIPPGAEIYTVSDGKDCSCSK